VAQFDIRNDISGFFPIDYQGIKIYMGDNKGLRHSWVDTDVINGKTYYYAVVSYDQGSDSLNMLPSECSRVIVRDLNGNVALDRNTVEVTPQAPAAGYKAAGIEDSVLHVVGFATGYIKADVINPLEVQNDQKFRVIFDDTTHQDTIAYTLVNITEESSPDTIFQNSFVVQGEDTNPLVDGTRVLAFTDSIEWDKGNSGWIKGACNLDIRVDRPYVLSGRHPGYPSSYEVRMGIQDTSWWFVPRFEVDFTVWDTYEDRKVLFQLEEPNEATRDSSISPGEYIKVIYKEGFVLREIWRINFLDPLDGSEPVLPESGDVLKIQIKTPFRSGDIYEFSTKAAEVDNEVAEDQLSEIAVVPNPYVAAARWEPTRLYATGRGERRIFFIHLPQKCTIRIFTISGELVQTLEHNSSMIDGAHSWDLRSKDGLDIAPGIYIYHVDAGSIGKKIGRFAIIK
jgi:hypothetical protein